MKTQTLHKWRVVAADGKVHRVNWYMSEDEVRTRYPGARELLPLGGVSFQEGETQEEIDQLARKRCHNSRDFEGIRSQ